jgi:hypothetical protein
VVPRVERHSGGRLQELLDHFKPIKGSQKVIKNSAISVEQPRPV